MPPKREMEATVYVLDAYTTDTNELNTWLGMMFADSQERARSSGTTSSTHDIAAIIVYNVDFMSGLKVHANWQPHQLEMVKGVLEGYEPAESNIIVALKCAYDLLTVAGHANEKAIVLKRIIVLSDFLTPFDYNEELQSQTAKLKSAFESDKIWLYVLGPNTKFQPVNEESDLIGRQYEPKDDISEGQTNNFRAVNDVMYRGVVADYETGFHLQVSYRQVVKLPFPWYAEFIITKDVRFKIVTYRCVDEPKTINAKNITEEAEEEKVVWTDTTTNEEVDESELISVFKFHDTIVDVTEEQEKHIVAMDTQKGLQLVSFVKESDIPELHHCDSELHFMEVDPRLHPGESAKTISFFSALSDELIKRGLVALTHRTYNKGNSPVWFVVKPLGEGYEDCRMLMIRLPESHMYGTLTEDYIKTKANDEEIPEVRNALFKFLDDMCEDESNIPLPPHLQVDPVDVETLHDTVTEILGLTPKQDDALELSKNLQESSKESAEELITILAQYGHNAPKDEEFEFDEKDPEFDIEEIDFDD